jgi:hypothetical protein
MQTPSLLARAGLAVRSAGSSPLHAVAAQVVRQSFSSSAPPQHNPGAPLFPSLLPVGPVAALNAAAARHPVSTGWVWLYHGPIAAALGTALVTLLAVPVAPELGPAFLLHTATRRLRLPLVLAAAGIAARLYPPLTTVPVATLVTSPFAALSVPAGVASAASKLDAAVGGSTLVNKYGLAYVVGGRVVGTVTLVGLAAGLRAGVDIASALDAAAASVDGALSGFWGTTAAATAGDAGGADSATGAAAATAGAGGGGGGGGGGFFSSALSAATGWTSRWAAGCLVANVAYPLVAEYVVARGGSAAGEYLERNPTAFAGLRG